MFFGRECSDHIAIILKMVGWSQIRSKLTPNLISGIKVYVRLFGIPEIGLQLRAQYFKNFIKELNFEKVLDAGCGLGYYSFYLGKKCPNSKIDACDFNKDFIKAGRDILQKLNLNNVHLFQADLMEFCQSNEYDLIIAIDVLEHIENDTRVVKNLCRALRKDGILYLHVPQKPLKRFFSDFDSATRIAGQSHVREGYILGELKNLLEKNNLRIIETVNTFGHIGSLSSQIFQLFLRCLPLAITALIFPALLMISNLDLMRTKSRGNGLLIIAQK